MQNHIADTQWQVMQIIWANPGCTSSFIIDKLSQRNNWSPTTVKTLLARLVGKGIIDFKVQKRTRMYYSLMTERDCVANEMKSVIYKIYGGSIHLETDHFTFFGDDQYAYIHSIAERLEGSYQKILGALACQMDNKVWVYTHQTLQRFHSAMGVQNGPAWMRAGWAWDIIHMAPEACFDNIDAPKAAVHIFAQIALSQVNPHLPYWMMQGISAFLSDWLTFERRLNAIGKIQNELSRDFIETISSDYKSFFDGFGYEIAYTIPEYIAAKYGPAHISQFAKAPERLETIFNCTSMDFWHGWKTFVYETYQRGESL